MKSCPLGHAPKLLFHLWSRNEKYPHAYNTQKSQMTHTSNVRKRDSGRTKTEPDRKSCVLSSWPLTRLTLNVVCGLRAPSAAPRDLKPPRTEDRKGQAGRRDPHAEWGQGRWAWVRGHLLIPLLCPGGRPSLQALASGGRSQGQSVGPSCALAAQGPGHLGVTSAQRHTRHCHGMTM